MTVLNKKIVQIARKILPNRFYPIARNYLHRYEIAHIREYYSAEHSDNNIELLEALDGLERYGFMIYPYEWADNTREEYRGNLEKIQVLKDGVLDLPYTIFDTKRLYFPREWDDKKIGEYYFGLQDIEQHPLSPHRYLSNDFTVDDGSVVVDCGVAEGNFGLDVVDKCKTLDLFEPEELWVEPLRATFAPWKDKVVIVQKYLSDKTDDQNVSLDDFFTGKEYPNFLKLDVEGYEERVLLGANTILSSAHLKKVVTCTYHKAEDEEVLGTLLRNHGFTTKPSEGYMIFLWDQNEFNPPYLRRGVLRATKHL